MTHTEMNLTMQRGLGRGYDGITIRAGDMIEHIISKDKYRIIRGRDGWVLEHTETMCKTPLDDVDIYDYYRVG